MTIDENLMCQAVTDGQQRRADKDTDEAECRDSAEDADKCDDER